MKPPPVMSTLLVTPGLVEAVVPGAYSGVCVAADVARLPVIAVPANGEPPAIPRLGWFRILKNSAREFQATVFAPGTLPWCPWLLRNPILPWTLPRKRLRGEQSNWGPYCIDFASGRRRWKSCLTVGAHRCCCTTCRKLLRRCLGDVSSPERRGEAASGQIKFRPFRGRSAICWSFTSPPSELSVVFTRGASPVTVTSLSRARPTSKVGFTTSSCATSRFSAVSVEVLNPSFSYPNHVMPGHQAGDTIRAIITGNCRARFVGFGVHHRNFRGRNSAARRIFHNPQKLSRLAERRLEWLQHQHSHRRKHALCPTHPLRTFHRTPSRKRNRCCRGSFSR